MKITETDSGRLIEVSELGVVREGKLTGPHDFYFFLKAFEGSTVHWTLKLVEDKKKEIK